MLLTWEQLYNSLSDSQKMIMDLADDNNIDLTELANIQVTRDESNTHFNEVIYGGN